MSLVDVICGTRKRQRGRSNQRKGAYQRGGNFGARPRILPRRESVRSYEEDNPRGLDGSKTAIYDCLICDIDVTWYQARLRNNTSSALRVHSQPAVTKWQDALEKRAASAASLYQGTK